MDIPLLIAEALIFIFPAYCANGTPVLAGGGTRMDFGHNFIDGRRIFGNNKTFRGFFFGWGVGIGVGLVEGLVFGFDKVPVLLSVLIPLGGLLGDLTGAFIKLRLDIPALDDLLRPRRVDGACEKDQWRQLGNHRHCRRIRLPRHHELAFCILTWRDWLRSQSR